VQKTVYSIEQGARRKLILDRFSPSPLGFVGTSTAEPAVRVAFKVEDKGDYFVLRIDNIEVPEGEHPTQLSYKFWRYTEAFPLSPDVIFANKGRLTFSHLIPGSVQGNFAPIAVWLRQSPEHTDDILYQIWVHEGLPHPNVADPWTVDRAKRWVSDYIKTFRNYSEMYVAADSYDDLLACVDHAKAMRIKTLYMHLNVWADRYHTTDRQTFYVNETLFPKGRPDLKRFCKHAQANGVGVAVRTLSHSISLMSDEFISLTPRKGLTHYWSGTLVEDIASNSREIRIQSDHHIPTSYNDRDDVRDFRDFALIGDEILRFTGFDDAPDGAITLRLSGKRAERGFGHTQPASHTKGTPVKLLKGTFNIRTVPDADSDLLDEIAANYARFNNEMKLANASFDGLEVHKCYVDYGPTRFLGLVYSKLDHPTVCRTSNGAPRWGWFEFRFNSVQKALGLSKSHSIPKRLQVRVGLHKDHHPAPGPYAATYAIPPNAVESHAWMSLQEQDGLHGVRRETLERFGLAEHYAKTIRAWRALGPKLPKHVRTRILNAYEGGGHYPLQREHFVLGKARDQIMVVPFSFLRRKGLDRGWGFIQEHGPVFTHQYLRPNSEGLEALHNPYKAQRPTFILRVMKDFDRTALSGIVQAADSSENTRHEALLEERLADAGIPMDFTNLSQVKGTVSYDLMIPEKGFTSKKKRGNNACNRGDMDLSFGHGTATISSSNQTNTVAEPALLYYPVSTSIQNAKGLGVVIEGDGSGALFVVRITGSGTRDYVIPLDFTGRKYVEIPDPQVSWSLEPWPITTAWKRWRGHTIKRVFCGLTMIPPKTTANVTVETIRLLPEVDSALIDPVIAYHQGKIAIQGTIPSEHHLWYKGGDVAKLYDLNWNPVGELPVITRTGVVPAGDSAIHIYSEAAPSQPWVECQFMVNDTPLKVPKR